MIRSVKIDNRYNYFVDTITGHKIIKYDPDNKNMKLIITNPDSVLTIDSSKIIKEFGGPITVQHDNDKYIIDDGFQNYLIKAGYIVYRDYDTFNEPDQDNGIRIRDMIIQQIRDILPEMSRDYSFSGIPSYVTSNANSTEIMIGDSDSDYSYIINFDTVNNIVNRNQRRRDNNLTYYPFDKSMDRYGTIYLSIFIQKNKSIKNNTPTKKYSIPNTFTKEFIKRLGGEYHFISLPVKEGQIIYCKGM